MPFDPATMIEYNRLALLRLLAGLLAHVESTADAVQISLLPRSKRWAVLKTLRAAESAGRRLIAALAHRVTLPDYVPRPRGTGKNTRSRNTSKSSRSVGFPMFDSLPKSGAARQKRPLIEPRILSFDEPITPQIIPEAVDLSPDDLIDSSSVYGRIHGLQRALEDLEARAKRFAQELKRRRHPACQRPKRATGLRPGLPPGYRKRITHEIDEILRDCMELERWMQKTPDTS